MVFKKGNQLSKLRKTFKHSEETKRRIGLANKGKTAWNKGKDIIFSGSFKKGHKINVGRKHSKEINEKISIKNIGKSKPHSKEWCLNQSNKMMGINNSMYGKYHSEETKQLISLINKGNKWTEETRKKIMKARENCINPMNNPIIREKSIRKCLEAQNIKPNKPEKIIINLLQQNNLNFIYVGDGKKIIEGFCPDFINEDKKLIIEHFGNYWHNREDMKEKDKRRLQTYQNNGYKTIIIWQKELDNLNEVLNKLKIFNDNGEK